MTSSVDISAYIGVVYPVLIFLSFFLVLYYAEPGFPWHSYITLSIGYFAAFGILLLVPIDLASVIVDRRSTLPLSETSYLSDISVLSSAYSSFFTILLIFGSIVLVFEEYYNTDGYFTVAGKLWSSLKRSVYDTFLGIVAGGIILAILIGQNVVGSSTEALQLAAVIVTNTVYEAFLMFLLGYGLVEFPRSLWRNSNLQSYLLAVQNRAAADFKRISEAQLDISLAVADAKMTEQKLSVYGDKSLTAAMQVVLADCPAEFRSSRHGKEATNKSGQITIESLASLRLKINAHRDRYRMAQCKADTTMMKAYFLEDLVTAITSGAQFIHWSTTDKDSSRLEYFWYCVWKPILYKFFALICIVLSVLSFLGVVCSMNGVDSKSSAYFLAVHDPNATPTGIVIFIFFTLGYTAWVALWSIFQMRFEGYVELMVGRTSPESLSFNVRMCARLAAPLAFFYLGFIAENGLDDGSWIDSNEPFSYNSTISYNTFTNSTTNSTISVPYNTTYIGNGPQPMPSAFSHFYQLQSVGVIHNTFGLIFPIMLYIIVGLILPNILNRLFVLLKMPYLQFGAEYVTDEQLREGKRQLERRKAATIRKFRNQGFRKFIENITKEEKKSGEGLFSFLTKNRRSEHRDESGLNDKPVLHEPEALSGTIEKKAASSFGLAGWTEFQAHVEGPNLLVFINPKEKKADKSREDVKITSIINFNAFPPNKRGECELHLEMGDGILRLRFKTEDEMSNWKKLLMEWKDYAIDFASMYPTGETNKIVNDVEQSEYTNPSTSTNTAGFRKSGAGGKSLMDELDSIMVEEGTDDEPAQIITKKQSSFGSLWKSKSKSNYNETFSNNSYTAENSKPQSIEGWVEKKGSSKLNMGNDWQRRYLRVDEVNGMLVYSKSSSTEGKASGIDLRQCTGIVFYQASNGSVDKTRFNVDMGEKVKAFKFKTSSAAEGERWVNSLNEWREYFLFQAV